MGKCWLRWFGVRRCGNWSCESRQVSGVWDRDGVDDGDGSENSVGGSDGEKGIVKGMFWWC